MVETKDRPIIVLKYGGSSIATTDNVKAVAQQIIRCKASGEDPVVVVSAMGESTDHFLTMAYQITEHPTARELDMLLSVGERISIALLAMAINSEGPYEAVSLTGSQVGIITDTQHTRARIVEIRCGRIHQVLEQGLIPIIAGFQGVSTDKEITTLGRGGSDTTAVALAAALKAKQCRIMKDVNGVYTADPRTVEDAHIINSLDYDQMLEFSATGSKVLASDAVALAREHRVEVAVGRTDSGAVGTIITSDNFTRSGVRGIVAKQGLIAYKLAKQSDLDQVLADFSAEGIPVQGLHSDGIKPVLLIEVSSQDMQKSLNIVCSKSTWAERTFRYKRPYSRLSIIGAGLEPGRELFGRILSILEEHHITPRWYCCSPVRVSFCIPEGLTKKTVKLLHRRLISSTLTSPVDA
ncbi:MAG: aspartate kinase [bacterium]